MKRAPIRFYRAVARLANDFSTSRNPQRMAIGVAALSLSVVMIWAAAWPSMAAAGRLPVGAAPLLAEAPEVDLNAAATTIETATKAIRDGLKRTQREIGKTEGRRAAIEHGRDRAVAKLEGLLERVQAAETLESLSDTDRLTLKRLALE